MPQQFLIGVENKEFFLTRNFLYSDKIFSNPFSAMTGAATWIGLKTITGKDGTWRYRSSKKAGPNTPWGPHQPNSGHDELCGYIATRQGSLADAHCEYKYAVACSERGIATKPEKSERVGLLNVRGTDKFAAGSDQEQVFGLID